MKHLIVLTMVSALAACAGTSTDGDGLAGDTPTPTPNTVGQFIDSPVEGLVYQTSKGRSGVTGSNGTFEFDAAGEVITFYIGGREIGSTNGLEIVTPMDMYELRSQFVTASDDKALNILRLMQTLDTDGDPTNGILLPSALVDYPLDFDQDTKSFEVDPNTVSYIAMNTNTSILVDPFDAASHFSATMSATNSSYMLDVTSSIWTSSITTNVPGCERAIGGFTYTTTATDYTIVGRDSFRPTGSNASRGCETGTNNYDDVNETHLYGSDPSFVFDCGPQCSYTDLNNIEVGVDTDGRDFIIMVHHVPNSGVIVYTKRIVLADGSSVVTKEILTQQ